MTEILASILWIIATLILPPCATEDAIHCYWDASASGNGTGSDFINW